MVPRKGIIITGLGFGDEGKGTITDAVTVKEDAKLVVLYNGGAQRAHNVVVGDTHHCFHQFGSGTLAGARTFLSRFVLFNPLALWYEAEELKKKGIPSPFSLISIDADALITTPYHVLVNRAREKSRGMLKHGSCGMGIGETQSYALQHPLLALRARDLKFPGIFRRKLQVMQEWAYGEIQGIGQEIPEQDFESCLEVYSGVISRIHMVENGRKFLSLALNESTVVFEGAQGVLLDEKHGFAPYNTWSNTTTENARELLRESGDSDITSLGVLRAYHTRHGAGPFPTEDSDLSENLQDIRNPRNAWQDSFRFGHFDAVMARYAVSVSGGVDCLALTCVDELRGFRTVSVATDHLGPKPEAECEDNTGRARDAMPVLKTMMVDECHGYRLADMVGLPLRVLSSGEKRNEKEFDF